MFLFFAHYVGSHVQIFNRELHYVFHLLFEVHAMGLESLEAENEYGRDIVDLDLFSGFNLVFAHVAVPSIVLV